MKVTATTIASAPVISTETRVGESVAAGKSTFALLSDLFKARLTFLVLLTTLVGFYVGSRGPINYLLM
ncbi:MAG: Protoheme farnesyltransferase, partial [Verrucomicrobiales bacterium]|nr:Protoheme farnesyltransferase [Verrucomicrobiales bacterium]